MTTTTNVNTNLLSHFKTIIGMDNMVLYKLVNTATGSNQSFSMMSDFEDMVYYLYNNYGGSLHKDVYDLLENESKLGINYTVKLIVEIASNWADAYANDSFVSDGKGEAMNEVLYEFADNYLQRVTPF